VVKKGRTDIICLPEGITVVGTRQSYYDVGETLPGPTSERLGTLAKELKSYVVAGIYEKEGSVLYNTAILVGRDGKLVGKYRKTHLPREEWEAGITPGGEYPVFETDFGKVGLIICWDVQFPEPSRAMALAGAEVLLLPIWGGNETLAKARAIENHVFLVSSSYDMKTFVVDPEGKVLAEATKEEPVAFAEMKLDRKIFQYWLGDMKARTWRERRPDLAID
jgi:predicted amidohydrolase